MLIGFVSIKREGVLSKTILLHLTDLETNEVNWKEWFHLKHMKEALIIQMR